MFIRSIAHAIALSLMATTLAAEPTVEDFEFKERLSPSAKISGATGFVRAVLAREVFEAGFEPILQQQLTAFVTGDAASLCVLYETRNGLYVGTGFGSVNNPPGWLEIPAYTGDEAETLEDFGTRAVAVSVVSAEDCRDVEAVRKGKRLLVRRADAPHTPDGYIVLAHVDRFSAEVEVYRAGTPNPIATAPCTRFQDGGNVAFNVQCALPPEALDPAVRAFLRVDGAGKSRPTRERISLDLQGLE